MDALNRWTLTLAGLMCEAWPPLPNLPGVVHLCKDAPASPEDLAAITCPRELALVAGISRQAAGQRLKRYPDGPTTTTPKETT